MPKSSPLWPWIKRIAKVAVGGYTLTDPVGGTVASLGTDFLTELQDEWNQADPKDRDATLRAALTEIHRDTDTIVAALAKENLQLQPDDLRETNRQVAEALYRIDLVEKSRYADFKGIAQLDRFVSLELDEIFVDMRVRPEKPASELSARELRSWALGPALARPR